MRRSVVLLGSTGSIGIQTLKVCLEKGINVLGLCANENIDLLQEQAKRFKPKVICIRNEKFYGELKRKLEGSSIEVVAGKEGVFRLCSLDCDIVVNAIVGVAGFLPTIFALKSGQDIALANKESLVVGGEIVKQIAKENGCLILPIDSEHSAIFQSISNHPKNEVEKIILTASGGPFFLKSRRFLEGVGVEDALKHPNWKMGKKISIDSATLMNKGLELIEAVHLFEKKPDEIEIVVHPQSVLHSAVQFVDGSILGQFSKADMRLPIQYALTYPEREVSSVEKFSFIDQQNLSFFKPDYETFSCLKFCRKAIEEKGLAPTILNAANEKAVELFLKGRIRFLDIERVIEKAFEIVNINDKLTIDSILETDSYIKKYLDGFF